MKNTEKFSSVICFMFGLVLSGCQTASLEDTVPAAALAPQAAENDVSLSQAGAQAGVAAQAVAKPVRRPENVQRSQQNSAAQASRSAIPAPGGVSIVPTANAPQVESKEFVASGARRTGEFPTFGREPTAANVQMTDAERIAAEAEMTELLRARASTPAARAQYEARLRQLRALAGSHASETQKQIEN